MTDPTWTPARRFWAKVERTPTCWLWTGANDGRHGYGHVWFGGRYQAAHRVSYQLEVGSIPEGLVLDHLCRNPPCVRPDHLEAVTPRTNTLRGVGGAAEKAQRTHCPAGHPYDTANTYRDKANRRYCRTCIAARKRSPAYKALARIREQQRWADRPRHAPLPRGRPPTKTHCIRGHELSGSNIRARKPYGRACLACERMRWQKAA